MAETPGSLVDKITIVQLKIFHHEEELERQDPAPGHIEMCKKNIGILKDQLKDLESEIEQLFTDVLNGKRKLKVFRQFKMYNDPKYKRDIVRGKD